MYLLFFSYPLKCFFIIIVIKAFNTTTKNSKSLKAKYIYGTIRQVYSWTNAVEIPFNYYF